jgi:hypothetical protein
MAMNQFHQDRSVPTKDVDWLGGKLWPLRQGKPVAFAIISGNPNARGKRKDPIVTITPGSTLGFGERVVVVSVINNGSTIVEIDCKSTAGLVLAGMPAKLAKLLLDKLRSTFTKEKHHGNSTSTPPRRRPKRPSSGATGFTPRRPPTSVVTRSAYRSTDRQR